MVALTHIVLKQQTFWPENFVLLRPATPLHKVMGETGANSSFDLKHLISGALSLDTWVDEHLMKA